MKRPHWARPYWPRDHGDETPREAGIRKKADAGNRYLYFAMCVFVIVIGLPVTQDIEHGYRTCQHNNEQALKFNKALDFFSASPTANAALTPQQQTDRARYLKDLHSKKYHCSGVWPFQP